MVADSKVFRLWSLLFEHSPTSGDVGLLKHTFNSYYFHIHQCGRIIFFSRDDSPLFILLLSDAPHTLRDTSQVKAQRCGT